MIKTLSLFGSVAVAVAVVTTMGCGSDNGGNSDGGFNLETGIYTASAARNVTDGCSQNPNDPADPLVGKQFLINVDATSGFIQFFGTTTATPVGTPPQPAQGQGTLSDGQAVLNRENDTTSAGCSYHLKVVNSILLTGNDSFTSAFARTETNHTGTCPSNRPDGCVTSFNWDLSK